MGIWLWVQALPAYLVSRWWVPGLTGLHRLLLALTLGFTTVPLFYFLLANAASIPMDGAFIGVTATAINVMGLIWLGPSLRASPDLGRRDLGVVFAVCVACAVYVLFGFRGIDAGDALTTIQHCLYVITLHGIQNDPSSSLPLYDAMTGEFMHFLIHHDPNLKGLSELFYEQRIGNVPVLGVPIATLGMAGWFVSTVHASVIVALASYLASLALGVRRVSALIGATVFVWASHTLCGYYLNENYLALALVAFLLWASLKEERSWGLVAVMGLVCGHLVGIRHPSVLFVPAAAVAIVWSAGPWRERTYKLALAGALSLLTVAPWLYINYIQLDGQMFTHPKVQPDSGGRVVSNAFAGHQFLFKPLNWPFTDQIVRAPWNPFPTLLWIPLLVMKSFGQLAIAGVLIGWTAIRGVRRPLAITLLFALPHTIAIGWLEGLDWEQITYIAPGLAPMAIWLSLGVDRLFAPRAQRRRVAIVWFFLVGLLAVGSMSVRNWDAPVDARLLEHARQQNEELGEDFWSELPRRTPAVQTVADRLTGFYPFPERPVFRTDWARRMVGTMAAVARSTDVQIVNDLPVYPSGHVILLSAYKEGIPRQYEFGLAPGPLRAPNTPVRTAVWLHNVMFQFPAERVEVSVVRTQSCLTAQGVERLAVSRCEENGGALIGRYEVDVVPYGDSEQLKDFSFFVNPWSPSARSIAVTLNGEPFPDLRVLRYGGRPDEDEELLIVTNYPPETVDLIEVPFRVVGGVEQQHYGIWVFLDDVDGTNIETLSPGGAMDLKWHGEREGVLILPRPIWADQLILFSEPYASDHIPQYGDHFGVLQGPFGVSTDPIEIHLDRVW